jgi:hypothetical protein
MPRIKYDMLNWSVTRELSHPDAAYGTRPFAYFRKTRYSLQLIAGPIVLYMREREGESARFRWTFRLQHRAETAL